MKDPPYLENHIDPELVIEDLYDDAEDLVEATEEDEEAGDLNGKSVGDFESSSGTGQVGTALASRIS